MGRPSASTSRRGCVRIAARVGEGAALTVVVGATRAVAGGAAGRDGAAVIRAGTVTGGMGGTMTGAVWRVAAGAQAESAIANARYKIQRVSRV